MTITIYEYRCRECGEEFLAPQAVGYGVLIMRSTGRGAAVLLRGLDDPVYGEVDTLLCEMGEYSNKSDLERADLLQAVFGAACDRDVDGSEYLIGAKPRCPRCGSRDMASWQPAKGTPSVRFSVPTVTHSGWNKLSAEEKRAVLTAVLSCLTQT